MDDAEGAPPRELKLNKARNVLTLTYADGAQMPLPAEYLRVESPSAEVQGHAPGQKITVAGKQGVTIKNIQPVGHYAVKLVFSDGHDTGLFTWPYLQQLGNEYAQRWETYENQLKIKGLSR
jgi:DUF971 family protein